jgi:hypothetical protein
MRSKEEINKFPYIMQRTKAAFIGDAATDIRPSARQSNRHAGLELARTSLRIET